MKDSDTFTFKKDVIINSNKCKHLIKKGAKAKVVDCIDKHKVKVVLKNDPFEEEFIVNKNLIHQ